MTNSWSGIKEQQVNKFYVKIGMNIQNQKKYIVLTTNYYDHTDEEMNSLSLPPCPRSLQWVMQLVTNPDIWTEGADVELFEGWVTRTICKVQETKCLCKNCGGGAADTKIIILFLNITYI